jgi:hypothetical protein
LTRGTIDICKGFRRMCDRKNTSLATYENCAFRKDNEGE